MGKITEISLFHVIKISAYNLDYSFINISATQFFLCFYVKDKQTYCNVQILRPSLFKICVFRQNFHLIIIYIICIIVLIFRVGWGFVTEKGVIAIEKKDRQRQRKGSDSDREKEAIAIEKRNRQRQRKGSDSNRESRVTSHQTLSFKIITSFY